MRVWNMKFSTILDEIFLNPKFSGEATAQTRPIYSNCTWPNRAFGVSPEI